MELVRTSAEHHFVTQLDQLAGKADGWYCLYFALSKQHSPQTLFSDLSAIETRLAEAGRKRDQFLDEAISTHAVGVKGYAYAFADHDVLFLCHAETEADKARIKEVYQVLSQRLPKGFSDLSSLASSQSNQQKLSDKKFLSAKLQEAYLALADANKVSSIGARRKRRKEPLVMVVEDDRFTAHYASSIISKEFDIILCKNAEEAIEAYIENAPDIVFMDIHLPGLSGHDAVEAIYAADREAFIVMLSVDTVKENVVKATQNGARKFLKKPFTRERLLDTVKASPFVRAQIRSDYAGHDTLMS